MNRETEDRVVNVFHIVSLIITGLVLGVVWSIGFAWIMLLLVEILG